MPALPPRLRPFSVLALGLLGSLLPGACQPAPDQAASALIRPESASVDNAFSLRGQAIAREKLEFTAPFNGAIITSIIPDGAMVRQGDTLATFESTAVQFELEKLLSQRETLQVELRRDLLEIENQTQSIADSLAQATDRLAIAQAEIAALERLPDPDKVTLAQTRLAVRRLAADAAAREAQRALERFNQGFIAQAELQKKNTERAIAQADLDEAQAELEVAQEPAEPHALAIAQATARRISIQVTKVQAELDENASFSAIKRKATEAKLNALEKQIKSQNAKLAAMTLKAPRAGFVQHAAFREPLAPGTTLHFGFRFLIQPDLNTLTVSSLLPEHLRKFIAEKAACRIIVDGHADKPIAATVTDISAAPEDIAFRQKARWGEKQIPTDVKVYEVTATPTSSPPWFRPGMNARLELRLSTPQSLPRISATLISYREGLPYAPIDGLMQRIEGFAAGPWFYLTSEGADKLAFTATGAWPTQSLDELSGTARRGFTANGVVEPIHSQPVIIPEIGIETRVLSIRPEDSTVKKGDVIMRLDPNPLKDLLSSLEKECADLESVFRRETIHLEQTRRSCQTEIKEEEITLFIASERLKIIEEVPDRKAIAAARADCARETARLLRASQQLQRLEERDPAFVSAAEKALAAEDRQLAALRLEAAKIRLAEAERGPDAVKRCEARVEFARSSQRSQRSIRKNTAAIDKAAADLQKASDDLQEKREQLTRVQAQLSRLQILAQADGVLVYEKIWQTGLKKIAPGFTVHPWLHVLSIPDPTSVRIRASVPERLYEAVTPGSKVLIRIPSLSNRSFPGRVESLEFNFITQQSIETSSDIWKNFEPTGDASFSVIILPDQILPELRPFSMAEVEFTPLEPAHGATP